MILAEHIEDCEHANIQTKIINFLAEEGPKAKNPSSYIRFIYNRVNLEKAVIRAASVTALAAFAHKVPPLKKSILLLLQKCLKDSDDEVRERAYFFIRVLEDQEETSVLAADYGENIDSFPLLDEAAGPCSLQDFVFNNAQTIDVDALEKYVRDNQSQLVNCEEGIQIDLTQMTSSDVKLRQLKRIELEKKEEKSNSEL